MTEAHHFLLSDVLVHNASAYTNFYCIGSPALTTYMGAAEYIARVVQDVIFTRPFNVEFSVIVHDHKSVTGMPRGVKSHAEAKQQGQPSAMITEPECNIRLSMLVTLTMPLQPSFSGRNSIQKAFTRHHDTLQDHISCMRIGGGKLVFPDGEPLTILHHYCDTPEDEKRLLSDLRGLPEGFFVADGADLYDEYLEAFEGDAMKAVVHACSLHRVDGKVMRNQAGWVSPTNVGYVAITESSKLAGRRSEELGVTYAEPVTGLIEYRFAPRILAKAKSLTGLSLQGVTFESQARDGAFMVVGK